jgi:hypothetical protein
MLSFIESRDFLAFRTGGRRVPAWHRRGLASEGRVRGTGRMLTSENEFRDIFTVVFGFAAALWGLICAIVWVADQVRAFKAARRAAATELAGHEGEPVVQGKKPKGTFN